MIAVSTYNYFSMSMAYAAAFGLALDRNCTPNPASSIFPGRLERSRLWICAFGFLQIIQCNNL